MDRRGAAGTNGGIPAAEYEVAFPQICVAVHFFLLFYPVSLTAEVNYLLDRAEPETYNATVEEPRESDDNYYLTVRFSDGTTGELEVPEEIYDVVVEGDTIAVYRHTGALGIPYYIYGELGGGF